MLVLLVYIIPFVLYFYTFNIVHVKAFLGAYGTLLLSESLKHFVIKKESPRPEGAENCNLWCNDGNQSGQPGMPSGHSTDVSFFAGYYWQHTDNIIIRSLLVIYAFIIMLSRYLKKCHTINQIIAGGLFGLSSSILVNRI
jgi:membrane-associated phospholipid phosphatase